MTSMIATIEFSGPNAKTPASILRYVREAHGPEAAAFLEGRAHFYQKVD